MSDRKIAIQAINTREMRNKIKDLFGFDRFGENVFNERIQKERLQDHIFLKLQSITKMGEELEPQIADQIAIAMKEWALEKGATHYCHWFQPLTNSTAEKHDSFFVPTNEGSALIDFKGEMLTRGEPDASSFPTGGLRSTFEARGYTAWDPSSPVFILGRLLIIPSVFLSWVGDALDKKMPLLRSMETLNVHALRLLRLCQNDSAKRVVVTVGAEQEYFLIDKQFYNLRPDLIFCGRTLFGARPPKGQELEDQYLGSIPDRVLAVMEEVELELIKIGVPIKTRHNEVAPSQFELALTFQNATRAADQNMLVMEIMRKVADRHGMVALFHEKPFAGLNGSGKHTNWSIAVEDGENLLDPGNTPQANVQFLLFCAAVVRAVHLHGGLLRASIASAGNDHRLGKHEAPPAIMSVFLGEQLFSIFHNLAGGEEKRRNHIFELAVGLSRLPKIPRHSSDRNRTSPFAFTGNKFEFRAVGSSENISRACTVLNTIVADSFDFFATELEQRIERVPFNQALESLLKEEARKFLPVLFEGDNYNTSWHKEAEVRGLVNIPNAVEALTLYTSPESVALFTKHKVFSRRELASREEIFLENYVKTLLIEAKTASSIAHTMILPAAIKYIHKVGEALVFLHNGEQELLKLISKEINQFRKAMKELDESIAKLFLEEKGERAKFARDHIAPALDLLRSYADRLEEIIEDSEWPLPKYREMLFIR